MAALPSPCRQNDIERCAIKEITDQLLSMGNKGRVWIDDWPGRYHQSLGPIRKFIASHPECFSIIPKGDRAYIVVLVEGDGANHVKAENWYDDADRDGNSISKNLIPESVVMQTGSTFNPLGLQVPRREVDYPVLNHVNSMQVDMRTIVDSRCSGVSNPSYRTPIGSLPFRRRAANKGVPAPPGWNGLGEFCNQVHALAEDVLLAANVPQDKFLLGPLQAGLEAVRLEEARAAEHDDLSRLAELKQISEIVDELLCSRLSDDAEQGLAQNVRRHMFTTARGAQREGHLFAEIVVFLSIAFLRSSLDACLQSVNIVKTNAVEAEEYLIAQTFKTLQGCLQSLPKLYPGQSLCLFLENVAKQTSSAQKNHSHAKDSVLKLEWYAAAAVMDDLSSAWHEIGTHAVALGCGRVTKDSVEPTFSPIPVHSISQDILKKSPDIHHLAQEDVHVGYALADFHGELYGDGFLSFEKGACLNKIASCKEDFGWIFGVCPRTLCEGWFPATYWEPSNHSNMQQ